MGCKVTCCLQQCAWIPLIRYIQIARSTRRDFFTKFQLEALNAHNELRQCHGANSLTLNTRLSKSCKAHAEWLAENDAFEHSEKTRRQFQSGICGENLGEFMVWHENYKPPNGRDVVFEWYKEGSQYKYNGKFGESTGKWQMCTGKWQMWQTI